MSRLRCHAEGMDAELMALSLKSPPETMRRSAAYFLERGEPEKAAALLHKAGDVNRAVELCFEKRLFEPLGVIVDAVAKRAKEARDAERRRKKTNTHAKTREDDAEGAGGRSARENVEEVHPELVDRCASWFMSEGRYDEAVSLCVASGRREEALTLVTRHDVRLTEDVAEALIDISESLGVKAQIVGRVEAHEGKPAVSVHGPEGIHRYG